MTPFSYAAKAKSQMWLGFACFSPFLRFCPVPYSTIYDPFWSNSTWGLSMSNCLDFIQIKVIYICGWALHVSGLFYHFAPSHILQFMTPLDQILHEACPCLRYLDFIQIELIGIRFVAGLCRFLVIFTILPPPIFYNLRPFLILCPCKVSFVLILSQFYLNWVRKLNRDKIWIK